MNLEQAKDRLKVVETKIKYIGFYNVLPMVMVALGFLAKFHEDPRAGSRIFKWK